MKYGMRTPNINKRISARTTGKITRTMNKAVNPLYGKKEWDLLMILAKLFITKFITKQQKVSTI